MNALEDLGYYWVHEAGFYSDSDLGVLKNYIDYERFGRNVRIDQGGCYIDDYGYIAMM